MIRLKFIFDGAEVAETDYPAIPRAGEYVETPLIRGVVRCVEWVPGNNQWTGQGLVMPAIHIDSHKSLYAKRAAESREAFDRRILVEQVKALRSRVHSDVCGSECSPDCVQAGRALKAVGEQVE